MMPPKALRGPFYFQMAITPQQLQSATLDDLRNNPELLRAAATAYGGFKDGVQQYDPKIASMWLSGQRDWNSDKVYAARNIAGGDRNDPTTAEYYGGGKYDPTEYKTVGDLPQNQSLPGGQGSPAGGAGGNGTALSPSSSQGQGTASGGFVSTGNPQLDALYKQMQDFVAQNQINPNIQLTPAELQRFYDQAAQEIDPYYASQISAIKDDLSKSVLNLQKQYDLEKETIGAQFKNTLSTSREQAAGAGTIFSGARGAGERDLASLYNNNLEQKALGLESSIGNTLRAQEGRVGSRNIASLGIPSFTSASASLEGKGGLTTGRTLSFSPTGGVTGSLEYQQNAQKRQLGDLLSQQEIDKRSRTGNPSSRFI